ncbi:MAG: hypothetical protein LC799_33625 [Actinobacteria bacterium]|nr:hypothetical protein [Actinomycetota bacterium]
MSTTHALRWVRSPLDQRSHALSDDDALGSVVALCGHLMPCSVQSSTELPSLRVCETCECEAPQPMFGTPPTI